MYKNIVIIILVFLLCSLMFQNKKNINILIGNVADTKEMVVDGTSYITKAFEEEFSVQEFDVDIDIPSLHPKKERFSEGSGIREETFFSEEEKNE